MVLSFCEAKRHISEADERHKLAKEEQHMFEDFLINKLVDHFLYTYVRWDSYLYFEFRYKLITKSVLKITF